MTSKLRTSEVLQLVNATWYYPFRSLTHTQRQNLLLAATYLTLEETSETIYNKVLKLLRDIRDALQLHPVAR
jgi:hypothetical protein